MTVKDHLQIVLITYNRAFYLQKTLEQILNPSSPIRDFDITILDNNSTDTTEQIVKSTQCGHSNLKYVRNRFNVGGNANIVKALEMARMDYLWILCDDDKYEWKGWPELEYLMEKESKLICVSNSYVKKEYRKDLPYRLNQMTFLPSIIYHKSLLTDTSIKNAYDSSVFLFPHLAPVISYINSGGIIQAIDHSLVVPGQYNNDASFTRGTKENDNFFRARTMTFQSVYANLCLNIKDHKLAQRCFYTRISGEHTHRLGFFGLCSEIFLHLNRRECACHITDIAALLPFTNRILIKLVYVFSLTPLQPFLAQSPLYAILRRHFDKKNTKLYAR